MWVIRQTDRMGSTGDSDPGAQEEVFQTEQDARKAFEEARADAKESFSLLLDEPDVFVVKDSLQTTLTLHEDE